MSLRASTAEDPSGECGGLGAATEVADDGRIRTSWRAAVVMTSTGGQAKLRDMPSAASTPGDGTAHAVLPVPS